MQLIHPKLVRKEISIFRSTKEMEIPVIDFSNLESKKRSETMALLHEACEKWGFFMVMKILFIYNLNDHFIKINCTIIVVSHVKIENHGIDRELMERVKHLTNQHYEENMKDSFYETKAVKTLENNGFISNKDWESSFFVRHHTSSNINELASLSQDLR